MPLLTRIGKFWRSFGPVLGLAPSYERDYHRDFPSELLGNRRTITVSLPPGYHADEGSRYPVLYLHDGRSESLEDVLTGPHAPDRVTGRGKLSADDLRDLIAYLKCL